MKISSSVLIFSLALGFYGCNTDPLDVDVTGKEVNLTFKRLDQDLFNLNPAAGQTDTEELKAKYDNFLVDYFDGILQIGHPEQESFDYSVAQFITDESMQTLHEDTELEYRQTADLEADLNTAFTYFHYHFPDSAIPEVVFMISALNFPVVATQSTLAIGLDMFLGSDYPIYPMVGLPQYVYTNLKRDQLVPQAMKGWLQSMYETDANRNTLLDYMVFEGKLLYAMDAILRESADSAKIGFTQSDMDWCEQYEARVWAHLVEQELIYTTDFMSINKWINQAPFVAGIPKDSPGRLGQWVGWQIVRNYMRNNPEVSVQQMMLEQDTQKILTESKYKPKL